MVARDDLCMHPGLQESPIDSRRTLYEHVVLSGGSTMYPGMASRMERDMRTLYMDKVMQVHTMDVCSV